MTISYVLVCFSIHRWIYGFVATTAVGPQRWQVIDVPVFHNEVLSLFKILAVSSFVI